MRDLLSCEAWNKNESQPDALLGVFPEKVLRKFPRSTPRKIPRRSPGKARWFDKEA